MNDLANIPNPWSSLGFPALSENATPGCQGLYGLPPCSESEFYRDFGKHHPVYAPFTTPMYSNLGIDILGLALEKISNLSYAEYIQQSILTPLGLRMSRKCKRRTSPARQKTSLYRGRISRHRNTSLSPPSLLDNAFVPNQTAETDLWGVDLGWDNAAGGFYSSSNDLITLGSAILNHSLLGSGATRKWLKPVSSTSTVGRSMGAPWEILRSTSLTADGRLIEMYTKGGDIGSYHSKLCLVPDYDLVISILTAGPEAQFQLSFAILSQLLATLLPAIEQAGQDEVAAMGMVGTFADAASDSAITLALDNNGPGLHISHWTVRGHDVPALYAANYVAGVGASTPVRPRLYPTTVQAGNQRAWRAVFDTGTAATAAQNDAQFVWPGQSCQTWANMDRFPYGFNGIDDFVFTLAQEGSGGGVMKVTSLTNRGFQVTMVKK